VGRQVGLTYVDHAGIDERDQLPPQGPRQLVTHRAQVCGHSVTVCPLRAGSDSIVRRRLMACSRGSPRRHSKVIGMSS